MTIKIKKIAATSWNGNGMGTRAASWAVVGAEHIHLERFGGGWFAIDRRGPDLPGRLPARYIVIGAATRADCLEILEVKLAAQA